jgi:hypothetical protein
LADSDAGENVPFVYQPILPEALFGRIASHRHRSEVRVLHVDDEPDFARMVATFLGRVRDRFGDLPFVLFTGKGSKELANEATSAGVTDYLQKTGGTDQYTLLARRVTNAVE